MKLGDTIISRGLSPIFTGNKSDEGINLMLIYKLNKRVDRATGQSSPNCLPLLKSDHLWWKIVEIFEQEQ